ncbi:MAG TPA: hypothetical protein VKX17_28670 [Planctomycetota bacterium]|nr:hypothetical protein [Planctomycetota bacterium]
MSDTLSADAPQDDAPATTPADPTKPAPRSVECPGCGAKVHNVAAEPGVKIRCLNCGERFVAFPAAHATAASAENAAAIQKSAEQKPVAREPQSAGYWILRIPAMIFALISVPLFAFICYALIRDLSRGFGPPAGLRMVQPFLYLLLFPLAGFFAFRVTRALARVEAGTIKAAWLGGLLRAPLPAAPGSSLPYILPIAAAPAVTLLVILVGGLKREFHRADDVIPFFLAIPLFFLLGFMCDDLRQFIWRQHALAENCAQNAGGAFPKSLAAFSWLGLLLALTLGLFACTILSILGTEYTREYKYTSYGIFDLDFENKYSGYEAQGMSAASLLCAIVTLFLLARNFRRAIGAWWDAGEVLPSRGHEAAYARQAIDVPMLAFRGAVYLFLFAFIVTVLGHINRYNSINTANQAWEYVAQFFALSACVMFALALVRLLADVRQWRKAQTLFWMAHTGQSSAPALSRPVRLVFFGTVALALLQALIFAIVQFERISGRTWGSPNWEDWMMEVPIGMFAAHAPIVWVALLSREFLLAERAADSLQAKESAADEHESTRMDADEKPVSNHTV